MKGSKLRIGHIRGALALILSVSGIGGGIVIVRQSARLAEYERRHEADVRAIGQLRAAAQQSQTHVEPPAAPSPEVRPAAPAGRPGAPDDGEIARRDAALEQVNREVSDARTLIANLQEQIQTAAREKQQALASADDLQNRERDLRDQLDSLKQQLDSARAESEAARERAAALEADNAKLAKDAGAGSTREAALRRDLTALQDLRRRRDGYLSSILRRYREVTDQLRALTGTLNSSHGAEAAPIDGIALTRIQNAITQAEEDMRRLNELNTQARQIETRLAK